MCILIDILESCWIISIDGEHLIVASACINMNVSIATVIGNCENKRERERRKI